MQVASCKDRGRQFILTLLSHCAIEFSFSLPYDYIVRRIKEQNIWEDLSEMVGLLFCFPGDPVPGYG